MSTTGQHCRPTYPVEAPATFLPVRSYGRIEPTPMTVECPVCHRKVEVERVDLAGQTVTLQRHNRST